VFAVFIAFSMTASWRILPCGDGDAKANRKGGKMMKVHQALNGFHIVKSKNGSFFTSRQCFNWLVLGKDITGHYWINQVIRRQEKKPK